MRRTVAAALALAAATALACGPAVESDRPADERQADPKRSREVVVRITEASGPYRVWVRAHEQGDARGDHTREAIAGGKYEQTLTYTSGLRIEVMIRASGHPSDVFECEIVDGQNVDRDRGKGEAHCQLTTSR